MATVIGRHAANILALLAEKVSKAGDTLSGSLTLENAKVRAGTTTDVLGSALEVIRNNVQIGRIDNNAGGLRVQAQAGTLQLRGSNNTGMAIDATGVVDFAEPPTLDGLPLVPASSVVKNWFPSGRWGLPGWGHLPSFTQAEGRNTGTLYLTPFRLDVPSTIDGAAIHVSTGIAGVTARLGIYKITDGAWTLVRDAGTVDCTFAGEKWIENLAEVQPAGYYAHAVCVSATINLTSTNSTPQFLGRVTPTGEVFRWFQAAHTFGPLPASITPSGLGWGNGIWPGIVKVI